MDWNAISKRLFKLGGQLVAAIFAYWILRQTGLHDFTRPEIEGISTLILLVGSIYAVVFAFAIFVIWGQFNDVENLVMRECNSLNDLFRFSRHLNPDDGHALRRAVTNYVQLVLASEWDALADRRRDKETENSFTKLTSAVIQTVPANATEEVIHRRLIDVARKAGEHRDDRITKSLTRIPPTLVWLVNIMAAALLLLMFVYPFHHWVAGAACFVLIALVLFFANLVMTDTDNPFKGLCNVSQQPFSDLLL